MSQRQPTQERRRQRGCRQQLAFRDEHGLVAEDGVASDLERRDREALIHRQRSRRAPATERLFHRGRTVSMLRWGASGVVHRGERAAGHGLPPSRVLTSARSPAILPTCGGRPGDMSRSWWSRSSARRARTPKRTEPPRPRAKRPPPRQPRSQPQPSHQQRRLRPRHRPRRQPSTPMSSARQSDSQKRLMSPENSFGWNLATKPQLRFLNPT